MVDSLWDTKITVLSFPIFFRDLKIILSFRESRLLVGSSRSKSGASCNYTIEHAIAMSGNYVVSERLKSREGDVVDVRETEKGYFVTMEFDE